MPVPHFVIHKAVKPGYISLLCVLILGAIASAISVSLLLLGLGSSRTSFAGVQSAQARGLANACAEEGLQKIRSLTAYTGSGTLNFGSGICDYTVTSQGGQKRTVTANGTVGTTIRKVRIVISTINPLIKITSWQEVSD